VTESKTIPFAVLVDGTVAFANPAFLSLFCAVNGLAGTPITQLFTSRNRVALGKLLSTPPECPVTFLGRAIRLDGSSFKVELHLARETLDGAPAICVFAEDITWRRLSKSNLAHLAFTDALTGLPNRAFLLDRLSDGVVMARAKKSALAVLMADLDGLKETNDSLGHQAGDALLQVMAERFLDCVRDSDTVARLGGDEFCILMTQISDGRDAETIAARIVEAARQPVAIAGQDLSIGVSVGIALFPDHGATGEAVIAAADSALYEAKRGGRNRYAWASAQASVPDAFSLPLIKWTAAYEVGVAMIDKQHRKLAEHINELVWSLQRGDAPSVMSDTLASTIAYTQFHFAAEERLMNEHMFAGAAAHREVHAHLLDDLRNFPTAHDVRSLSLTARFLQEWLLRHIATLDRALAKEINAGEIR
jgi:diguanylate cyclase (GGDEF)-like protein/hemerythrin-like metal-binding protein